MFFFSSGNDTICFSPESIEHGYAAILSGDLDSAKAVFECIDSPRSHWGITLIGILSGCIERLPSYFDIRNFLEIDLDFLIKNEKIHYIEMVLSSLDKLTEINQEVYKYAARVMYENGFFKTAKDYMDKSKHIFYKDPELHYMYAKYYLKEQCCEDAYFHICECLKIVPTYYPALQIKKQILKYFD